MSIRLNFFVALIAVSIPSGLWAQAPATPMPEHKVLKKEAGRWAAAIKLYPGQGERQESEGVEVNKMIGEFWLVSDFKGDMMGQDFHGHGTFGYDPATKKYSGTWIDSFSPNAMHMVGEYDKSTKTMTYVGEGQGPDGSPMKNKLVTVFKEDGTRYTTMHATSPDGSEEWVKVMEIVYTKVKRPGKKNQ